MARNSLLADWAGYITSGTISSSATFPAGHILQVQSSAKLDVGNFSSASTNTFQNWSGTDQNGAGSIWCVKITPSATSSKIWLIYHCSISNTTSATMVLRFARDGSATGVGTQVGNKIGATSAERDAGSTMYSLQRHIQVGTFLDSPTIPSTPVAITYKCQIKVQQSVTDDDNARTNPNISSGNKGMFIMAQEIAG